MLQAAKTLTGTARNGGYSGSEGRVGVKRMTAEAVHSICEERNLWPQPHLNTQLYLNYKGFETIECLEEYCNIRVLHLGNNFIATIEGLERMTDLRCLQLEGNRIQHIDNLTTNLELRQLTLDSNAIKRIENLSHLKHLQQLSLAKNAIEKLEDMEELKSMPSLNNVDVSHNQLEVTEGVVEFWSGMPPGVKLLRYHGNPGIRNIEHYRKRMVNALPGVTYLDERPIFPVEVKSCAAWASGGLQAMQEAKRTFVREQQRAQTVIDPERGAFLSQMRKMALARIDREEKEQAEQAEKDEASRAEPMTRAQAGDKDALENYADSWKRKVELYGAEGVRAQITSQAAHGGDSAKAMAAIAEAQRKASQVQQRQSGIQADRCVGSAAARFDPPPRAGPASAATAASSRLSGAADFRAAGPSANADHADRVFEQLEGVDLDAPKAGRAEREQKPAQGEVVPDLWKRLESSNKEQEARILEMNAASSAAWHQSSRDSAPTESVTNELEGLD